RSAAALPFARLAGGLPCGPGLRGGVERALNPDLPDGDGVPPPAALLLDLDHAAAGHQLEDEGPARAVVDLGGLAGQLSRDADHGAHLSGLAARASASAAARACKRPEVFSRPASCSARARWRVSSARSQQSWRRFSSRKAQCASAIIAGSSRSEGRF